MTVRQHIEDLLKAGKTPKEIKSIIGYVHGSYVSRVRREIGMVAFSPGAPKGYRNKNIAERVRKMKVAGMSYAEIGRALGFSHQRAQQYIMRSKPSKTPKECSKCKAIGLGFHRHHCDYNNDDVEILCPRCHPKEKHPKTGRPRKAK